MEKEFSVNYNNFFKKISDNVMSILFLLAENVFELTIT